VKYVAGMLEKEEETRLTEEAKLKPTKGKKRGIDEVQKVEKHESRPEELYVCAVRRWR